MAVNTTVQVTLPQMGESVTEGTVLEWHKQEGDQVEADETLVEISTDKVDAEVPSPASRHRREDPRRRGRHRHRRRRARRDRDRERRRARGAAPEPSAEAAAAPAAAPRARRRRRRRRGEIVDIVTPAGGESVTEGTILEWAVKVGDAVEDGQTIVEISTDKVDMELPAPAAGTITEILAEEGETVTVGQVIARMQAGAGRRRAARRPSRRGNGAAAPSAPAPVVPDDAKISPVAARVAAAEGVDLERVAGTGPGGRITKADVLAAERQRRERRAARRGRAGDRRQAHAAQGRRGDARPLHGREPLDPDRDLVPHASPSRRWTRRRKQLKDAGQKVSFTHLIAYAIVAGRAARHAGDGPPLRRESTASRTASTTARSTSGIAVDVEKKDGTRTLMVPVIRDAGRMTFAELRRRLRRAHRARRAPTR